MLEAMRAHTSPQGCDDPSPFYLPAHLCKAGARTVRIFSPSPTPLTFSLRLGRTQTRAAAAPPPLRALSLASVFKAHEREPHRKPLQLLAPKGHALARYVPFCPLFP